MEKPFFCICENKDADQLRITAKLISAFVFATQIVKSLFFLNMKFQASSDLLWLSSPVFDRHFRISMYVYVLMLFLMTFFMYIKMYKMNCLSM